MSRATVYRSVGPKRRTTVPRSRSSSSTSMSAFGLMLAKLTLAGDSLQKSRPRRRGR